VISLLLLACGSQSYEPTRIDSLQVVAVRLDRPELRAGEVTAISSHIANPDELAVEVLTWTCLQVEVEGEGCVEAQAWSSPSDWISLSTLEGSTAFARREVPEELDEVFAAVGSSFELPLYVLACETGACPIIEEARAALDQGVVSERLQQALRAPEAWLQKLDPDRTSLTVRLVRISDSSESNLNENPTFEARFAEADEPLIEGRAGSLVDLSFLTSDPNFESVYLYSFTTIGRFAERRVKAESQIVRTWLELPPNEGEGQVWVVFDDRDGGIAVYSQEVSVTQ